jgi:hypothetical protein
VASVPGTSWIRTDEAVAASHHRFEKPRRVRIVPERPSHLSHGGVDGRVCVDEDVAAPEALEDLGSSHELSSPLGEEYEQLHRELLELLDLAAAAQLVAPKVQLHVRRDGIP